VILDRIVARKAEEVVALTAPRKSLFEALAVSGMSVIGEIKRGSPSKGAFAMDADLPAKVEAYERGGVAALSILTDRDFFLGGEDVLCSLRSGTELPILRKDFLIHPVQLEQSRLIGADAVLLIAAILPGDGLKEMISQTAKLGMEPLVEVHDEKELHRALEADAKIVGINNRDLRDFSVDLSVSERLIGEMARLGARDGRVVVGESGIGSGKDTKRLNAAGVDAVLVGEALMRSDDPVSIVAELREAP
jgi:indole-3-glycerol phosphate synthase